MRILFAPVELGALTHLKFDPKLLTFRTHFQDGTARKHVRGHSVRDDERGGGTDEEGQHEKTRKYRASNP